MLAGDVISMPDKWEYPWFAAWDLAFHCAPLALVDVDFAKQQVELLLRTRYVHPNGQIPAYEWNFSDVNPPVTAWAALYVYEREAEIRGEGDVRVPEARLRPPAERTSRGGSTARTPMIATCSRAASSVSTTSGSSIARRRCPAAARSSRRTAPRGWRSTAQWMLQIAVELSMHDPAYVDMALKFLAHFVWIAVAMNPPEGDTPLWDEQDGFYYDVMRMPDGQAIQLKVRSLVGLLPMCAATVFDGALIERYPWLLERLQEFVERFSDSLPQLADGPGPNREGRRIALARRRAAPTADPGGDARRGRVPRRPRDPLDLPPPPRAPVRVRLGRSGYVVKLPAGRVRHGHVRRQLELARAGLVPDEPRDPARPGPAPPLLRRSAEGRVSNGLGP